MRSPLIFSLTLLSVAFAHPTSEKRDGQSAAGDAIKKLVEGNQRFITEIAAAHPGFWDEHWKGQEPPFSLLSCSDSRVSEGKIFDADPGTLFTHRNIANRYDRANAAGTSWLSYGISALGVQHIVVLGHYGCGGVQGAMLPRQNTTYNPQGAALQAWIDPIRELYETSEHPEIVKSRATPLVKAPEYDDPAFKALVEENAKRSARTIYADPAIVNHYQDLAIQEAKGPVTKARAVDPNAPKHPVFIHSWVYDLKTGHIIDLKYSFGPKGHDIPTLDGHSADPHAEPGATKRDATYTLKRVFSFF